MCDTVHGVRSLYKLKTVQLNWHRDVFRTLSNISILNGKFNPKINIIKVSFQNQDIRFLKGQGRSPLFPLVAHLWVWLNMHQYPWVCIHILENTWINCSVYARALNMQACQWMACNSTCMHPYMPVFKCAIVTRAKLYMMS